MSVIDSRQKTLHNELISFGITYPEMAKATGYSEGQIKQWFYRCAINDKRYAIIKKGIERVIDNRLKEVTKAKEVLLNG